MKPLISVVIPTYNRERTVLSCVRDVLQQTYDNIEVLVVDDCSTDATLAALEAIEDPRLRILRMARNGGGGAARNLGIDEARGTFIAFLDSDDGWLPDKLDKQYAVLAGAPRAPSIAYTNLILDDGEICRAIFNRPWPKGQNVCEYLFVNWSETFIQTSSWLMPVGVARSVRFDDALRLHQDWDFLARAEQQGVRFLEIPEPLTIWAVDERKDRVSLNHRRLERSLAWVENRRDHIGRRGVSAIMAWRALDIAPTNLPKALFWVAQGLLRGGVRLEKAIWIARRCWFLKKRKWGLIPTESTITHS